MLVYGFEQGQLFVLFVERCALVLLSRQYHLMLRNRIHQFFWLPVSIGCLEFLLVHDAGQERNRIAIPETLPRGFNQPACDGIAALREVASLSWRNFKPDLQQDIVTVIFAPKPEACRLHVFGHTGWCHGVLSKFRNAMYVHFLSVFTDYLMDLIHVHHCRIYEWLGTTMDMKHAFVALELKKIGVLQSYSSLGATSRRSLRPSKAIH
ncbi:hypothetical protein GHT06_021437 [Daphnia sinensis]|uniref:Uncharacterized protein n=1 Tax=Daphnia sinensis TaxID=1820382 RepID=A0AAD5KJ54_9CRUS|nr:hypothetical protein GHT06_021437 [Daphnia sinensis]